MKLIAQIDDPHGPLELHFEAAHGVTGSAPLALVLPALGTPATYYTPSVDALAAQGWHAAVLGMPSVGHTSAFKRAARGRGYSDIATEVIPQAWDKLEQVCAASERVLIGNSLGGQLALLSSALGPVTPDRLVLIGVASPHWRGYGKELERKRLIQTTAVRGMTRVLGHWPGDRFGFGGRQSAALMADWGRLATHNTFAPTRDGQDPGPALATLTVPTLAVTLYGDNLAPRGALDALLRNTPALPVTHVLLGDADNRPGHLRWARRPENFIRALQEWVQDCQPSPR